MIIKVGEAIGIWPTLALLILDGFLGAYLARTQGRAAWERFNRALSRIWIGDKPVQTDLKKALLGG